MKIKLLIVPDKGKQIIFTPESEEEKQVLKLFSEPNIEIFKNVDFEIETCQGGYYRPYPVSNDSIVLLIKKNTQCL